MLWKETTRSHCVDCSRVQTHTQMQYLSSWLFSSKWQDCCRLWNFMWQVASKQQQSLCDKDSQLTSVIPQPHSSQVIVPCLILSEQIWRLCFILCFNTIFLQMLSLTDLLLWNQITTGVFAVCCWNDNKWLWQKVFLCRTNPPNASPLSP